jgi:hypothetical protein
MDSPPSGSDTVSGKFSLESLCRRPPRSYIRIRKAFYIYTAILPESMVDFHNPLGLIHPLVFINRGECESLSPALPIGMEYHVSDEDLKTLLGILMSGWS